MTPVLFRAVVGDDSAVIGLAPDNTIWTREHKFSAEWTAIEGPPGVVHLIWLRTVDNARPDLCAQTTDGRLWVIREGFNFVGWDPLTYDVLTTPE